MLIHAAEPGFLPARAVVLGAQGFVGRAAVRAIVERLVHPDGPPRAVRLPVEVLLRESCPPALGT